MRLGTMTLYHIMHECQIIITRNLWKLYVDKPRFPSILCMDAICCFLVSILWKLYVDR